VSSGHADTFVAVKRVRRFSAEELVDDACSYSSDDLDPRLSFREYNAQQNRLYEMDMRDFRRLPDVRVTPATDHRLKLVYFVQAWGGGPVKIGTSTAAAIAQRLVTLQIGNPRKLAFRRIVEGDWRIEPALHSYFRAQHVRGEWFDYDGSLELEEISTPRWAWERKHGQTNSH
jgi:hypothetical protein